MSLKVVLTVEDEFLISLALGDMLEAAGYEVIATSNADEAITVLESRPDVRLIITDVDMPGSMDGLKLAAAVRDRWPPVKIIVTSGKQRPTESSMPDGSFFMPKPYTTTQLSDAVQRVGF
jgi:DNA-binding NtrC family response regulator